MRERNLLYLFLGLNVALAGAFMVYLFLSTNRQPEVVAATFVPGTKTNSNTPGPEARTAKTNHTLAATNKTVPSPVAVAQTNVMVAAPAAKPIFTSKKFTWQDVETDGYRAYIESL